MHTTTHINVSDWFTNSYSNSELFDILQDFSNDLNVPITVSANAGRCTLASELERLSSIEKNQATIRNV